MIFSQSCTIFWSSSLSPYSVRMRSFSPTRTVPAQGHIPWPMTNRSTQRRVATSIYCVLGSTFAVIELALEVKNLVDVSIRRGDVLNMMKFGRAWAVWRREMTALTRRRRAPHHTIITWQQMLSTPLDTAFYYVMLINCWYSSTVIKFFESGWQEHRGGDYPFQTIPDHDFHRSEKFQKHYSCTSITTFECKCSNFDQITLATEHDAL